MTAWRWVGTDLVYAVHDRQIAEHGGLDGLRDRGAVEAALARPQNIAAYGDPDAAAFATAYANSLLRNRGFADGNKRTAWVTARLFLADNGYRLSFNPIEAVRMIETLAAGAIAEDQFAAWLRDRLEKV